MCDELDIKFDPTSLLETNMSVDEDDKDEKDVKNNSIDLFAEDDKNFETDDEETSKSDDIDIIDSLPVNGEDDQLPSATSTQLIATSITPPVPDKETNLVDESKEAGNENKTTTTATTTNNNNKPQQDELLEDSVNMDEAIQYMVTNSMDPFADVDEILLEDIPM